MAADGILSEKKHQVYTLQTDIIHRNDGPALHLAINADAAASADIYCYLMRSHIRSKLETAIKEHRLYWELPRFKLDIVMGGASAINLYERSGHFNISIIDSDGKILPDEDRKKFATTLSSILMDVVPPLLDEVVDQNLTGKTKPIEDRIANQLRVTLRYDNKPEAVEALKRAMDDAGIIPNETQVEKVLNLLQERQRGRRPG